MGKARNRKLKQLDAIGSHAFLASGYLLKCYLVLVSVTFKWANGLMAPYFQSRTKQALCGTFRVASYR